MVGLFTLFLGTKTVRNLAVKTRALTQPLRKYKSWLNDKKEEWHYSMEQEMVRVKGESVFVFSYRWWYCYLYLSDLYNSKVAKKKLWDSKQAHRGEFDR